MVVVKVELPEAGILLLLGVKGLKEIEQEIIKELIN
jgi:hypothetical protein